MDDQHAFDDDTHSPVTCFLLFQDELLISPLFEVVGVQVTDL